MGSLAVVLTSRRPLLFIRVTQPIRLHKVTVSRVRSEISTLANEIRALLVDLIFN